MNRPNLHPQHLVRIIILIGLLLFPACIPGSQQQVNQLSPITIGVDTTAVNTLIFIAQSKNYFRDNGLNVSIKSFPSGLASIEAALKNEIDVAVASEFALMGKIFTGEPLHAWGSIDEFMHVSLVVRTGKDILAVTDLRGKKIGFPFKTSAEFFLGRYLDLHGMSLHEVTPVNISPPDLPAALQDGEVDAVVTWPPYTRTIEDLIGADQVIRWPVQSNQAGYGMLISSDSWIAEHPDVIERVLKALIQAEAFYARNPQEVTAILKANLPYDDALLASVLSEHQFQVALDQSMILAMEDEARWMINNQIVTSTQTPHFVNYLYLEGLQSVRPDSVNIIR